jgi:hypothetical protein
MLFEQLMLLTNKVADLERQIKPNKKQKNYNYVDAAEILCITVSALKKRVVRGQIQRITNFGTPMIAHTEIQRVLKSQNPDYREE